MRGPENRNRGERVLARLSRDGGGRTLDDAFRSGPLRDRADACALGSVEHIALAGYGAPDVYRAWLCVGKLYESGIGRFRRWTTVRTWRRRRGFLSDCRRLFFGQGRGHHVQCRRFARTSRRHRACDCPRIWLGRYRSDGSRLYGYGAACPQRAGTVLLSIARQAGIRTGIASKPFTKFEFIRLGSP